MTTAYIGAVHQEGSSAWGICFPDLPGCFSAADDFADLPAQAAEAVALHLEGLIAEGLAEPKPSTLAQVRAHQDSKGAVSFLPISAIRRRIVTPGPNPLSDLLTQITPDNLHQEARTEDDVGKEIWCIPRGTSSPRSRPSSGIPAHALPHRQPGHDPPNVVETADGPFPRYDDAGKKVIRYQHEKGRIAHKALAWIRVQI